LFFKAVYFGTARDLSFVVFGFVYWWFFYTKFTLRKLKNSFDKQKKNIYMCVFVCVRYLCQFM